MNRCKTALLLTDVPAFAARYKDVANDCGVKIVTEETWKSIYRIQEEVIICGSKYIEYINPAYFPSVVVILKPSDNMFNLMNIGIRRFIFNYEDERELAFAFVKPEIEYAKETEKIIEDVLEESAAVKFICKDYEFHFNTDKFYYKGNGIYLTKGEKMYLAEWLLNGKKDNSKRMFIFKLRKKFGEDFLRDIDRHGRMKE